MVVKILDSVGSFHGIEYNEKKTIKGKSELLSAKNFGILDIAGTASKQDYVNYMKRVASLNPEIKKTQFHAVISTKGGEHSTEELHLIAERYLEKMGYGNNPYLIYSHNDTANNHVHMVSTRVDKEGKAVKNSFEYLKSQKVINEIMKLSPELAYSNDKENVFKYNISTEAQFKLLFEKKGYTISNANDQVLNIYKYGQKVGEISKDEILNKIQSSNVAKENIQQTKAIIDKYKSIYNPVLNWKGEKLPGGGESTTIGKYSSNLSEYLKNKHGLEMEFHSKNGLTPYGYTIIDNKNKSIYKGSEIMPLGKLITKDESKVLTEEKTKEIDKLILNAKSLADLRLELKGYGGSISNKGIIKFQGQPSNFLISDEYLKSLKYEDRLIKANSFNPSTTKERNVVASINYVKPQDIKVTDKNYDNSAELILKLKDAINNNQELGQALKNENAKILSNQSEIFLVGTKEPSIINIKESFNQQELAYIMERVNIKEQGGEQQVKNIFDQGQTKQEDDKNEVAELIVDFFDGVSGIFQQMKNEKDTGKKKSKEHNPGLSR